jgi:hypothetical protein
MRYSTPECSCNPCRVSLDLPDAHNRQVPQRIRPSPRALMHATCPIDTPLRVVLANVLRHTLLPTPLFQSYYMCLRNYTPYYVTHLHEYVAHVCPPRLLLVHIIITHTSSLRMCVCPLLLCHTRFLSTSRCTLAAMPTLAPLCVFLSICAHSLMIMHLINTCLYLPTRTCVCAYARTLLTVCEHGHSVLPFLSMHSFHHVYAHKYTPCL